LYAHALCIYLRSSWQRFDPQPFFWIDTIAKENRILLMFWIPLKTTNWAKIGEALSIQTELLLHAQNTLHLLQIGYVPPTQPVLLYKAKGPKPLYG
jgi:hypothetical protein